jgi:succinate dehydrogenase hydrophobic anchor subunit
MESLISSQESITMTATTTEPQGLTHYSRFVLFGLVLPLLFIAGVQLFILAEQTETYFAWTFAAPFSAAFMGAGYWAAMLHAYSGSRASSWATVRTSLPAALTATTLLTITTFIHLDKFHFDSPLFITRFVTWVWIVVYVTVPFILFAAWVIQARLPGADVKGRHPLRGWMRGGFMLLAAFALLSGLALFIAPTAMSALWPWEVTPLAGRAISSWLTAFGLACASLALENDIKHGAGTASSLFAFCILQLIVVARYSPVIDWGKPLSSVYILFLVFGTLISGANLLADRILSKK